MIHGRFWWKSKRGAVPVHSRLNRVREALVNGVGLLVFLVTPQESPRPLITRQVRQISCKDFADFTGRGLVELGEDLFIKLSFPVRFVGFGHEVPSGLIAVLPRCW